MTEWTPQIVGRLFELYEQFIDRLMEDVVATNLSLGSLSPSKTRLKRLSLQEFRDILTHPDRDDEVIELWVRRIIRGHEDEFPALQAAG